MKKQILYAIYALIVVSTGCDKTAITDNPPNNILKLTLDGNEWEAEKIFVTGNAQKFTISAENIYPGEYYETHEHLSIENLNIYTQKQQIIPGEKIVNGNLYSAKAAVVSAQFSIGASDVTEGVYKVAEDPAGGNYVIIDGYNADTKELNGHFAIFMLIDYYKPGKKLYGSGVRIEEGRFSLKVE